MIVLGNYNIALLVNFFYYYCFGQILFNLGHCTFAVHNEKSFVPAFFKGYIDHLFDNLESGKRNYCFGNGLEIVLNFG